MIPLSSFYRFPPERERLFNLTAVMNFLSLLSEQLTLFLVSLLVAPVMEMIRSSETSVLTRLPHVVTFQKTAFFKN
jgi:hypothetical protein